jgi:cytochrome oxidase Cu insertion factor (SCO1/SenC/PrrC family)
MRRLVLAATAALAAAAVAAPAPAEAQSRRWGDGYFPNLPVVTQDGKTLRFYDDVLKGKIVVVNFMYTNCPDICGLTTARLSQAEEKLHDMVGRDLFFVSLSVDPENDTPQKLKEFADSFHLGDGWLFLTGKPEDIRAINAKFGEHTRSLDQHRQEVILGNDATGEWQRNSALGDIERFIMDVRAMDPKWRDQVRTALPSTAVEAGYQISSQPGQVLFKKMCAPCHTIGVGDRAGPDLRDVTARRDREWLTRFIMDAYKMRREKDPTALALTDKYKGVLMPRLGLTRNDAADVIAYVETQSSRLSTHQVASPPPRATIGGPFALVDHRGKSVTERDYLGKPALVFFGFTNCPDVCPTTLYQLSNMLKRLKSDADRLNVLFITVDPERDTPEQLALYLSSFDPRITGLSGTSDAIAAAVESYQAYVRKVPLKDGEYTMDHTAAVFMMDRKGQYVGTISLRETEAAMRAKIRHLLDAAHS